jgi:hypothetical protein
MLVLAQEEQQKKSDAGQYVVDAHIEQHKLFLRGVLP